jgi:hypothetical protein
LFKRCLNISQDTDFASLVPADPAAVAAFKDAGGEGPTLERLQFDVMGGLKSVWNVAAFDLLVDELASIRERENWDLPGRSHAYYLLMVTERFKRLCLEWKKMRPKIASDGSLETPVQVEERLNDGREARLRATRHLTRRSHVSRQTNA